MRVAPATARLLPSVAARTVMAVRVTRTPTSLAHQLPTAPTIVRRHRSWLRFTTCRATELHHRLQDRTLLLAVSSRPASQTVSSCRIPYRMPTRIRRKEYLFSLELHRQ